MKKNDRRNEDKRRPDTGELIFRLSYVPDLSGRVPRLYPAIVVLGDRKGFAWLAEFFSRMAKHRISEFERFDDPYLHDHIHGNEEIVNSSLSHRMEFYVARIDKNRTANLKRFGIRKPQRVGMIELFERVTADAKRFISRNTSPVCKNFSKF